MCFALIMASGLLITGVHHPAHADEIKRLEDLGHAYRGDQKFTGRNTTWMRSTLSSRRLSPRSRRAPIAMTFETCACPRIFEMHSTGPVAVNGRALIRSASLGAEAF